MVKILYLEDEHYLGRIVKESLQSRGYNIQLVTDGNDVIRIFNELEPDICVLDVMVPNVDGFSLGKEIKRLSPDTPIIFLTAKNQTEDVLEGFQSGGNDYMKKPFSMEELIVRTENLLALKNSNSTIKVGSVVSIGEYLFIYDKFLLQRNDANVSLSHRENELIKLLYENINNKIDRKDILMRIWGDDSIYNSRNLDVYIRKIRQYFADDSNIQLITLRGVGYHFSVSP